MILLKISRSLPNFKGKIRLVSFIVKDLLNSKEAITFIGKNQLTYTIPNTIDTVGKSLLIKGVYEKKTIDLIKKSLTPSSVFFDVGANIGSITLPVARTTGAKVYAFEPSKLSFPFLKKNVLDNNLDNIILNNYAVYSEDRIQLQFYESEEKYGNSSFSNTIKDQQHYFVQTVSLDNYCNRNKVSKINMLKIDVQGYEIEVLKGALSLLKKKGIDVIIFEMESWAEKQAGYSVGAAQEFLLMNGYQLFTINNKKINKIITEGKHMIIARPKE
jgi:FkbM family methyltransferase